jgi:fatty acid desaturase
MASSEQGLSAGGVSVSRGGWGAYTQLSRQVRQAGLLERRRGWYVARIGLNLALLAAGWVAFFLIGSSWWQLGVAAGLAVVWTQIAFVGHDAGHRQLFRSRRANDLVGLLHANLLVGVSFEWWVAKHNAHHTNPNHQDLDPDIRITALAFTADQARAKHGLLRLVARYQGWLFFPLLLLEAVHLHSASVKAVLGGRGRANAVEGLLLVAHLVVYLAVVVVVLPPLQALGFVVVHQGLFGLYLGCSFAPNHKGMATLSGAEPLDFVRRQVLTSRNVAGSRLVEVVLGGLNYQIEHHLFPNMPRPNLRRAQPLVRAFCQEHGLAYTEAGLFSSYAQAIRHLHSVGTPLRPPVAE